MIRILIRLLIRDYNRGNGFNRVPTVPTVPTSLSISPLLSCSLLLSTQSTIMEQAPSLTMNINSGPSTPRLDPVAQVPVEKEADADASSLASTSTITPDTPPKDTSNDGATKAKAKETVSEGDDTKTEAQTARERAFQHGLDKNNFETEVHQVMGTLNSWWGGVKKQVSGDPMIYT